MKMINLFIIGALILSGCKTANVVTQIPVNTSTKVVDREVSVAAPKDSAVINLSFLANEGGGAKGSVDLKSYQEVKTAGLETSFKKNENGITIRIKTIRDTIRVQAHDSIVIREIPIIKNVTVEVAKPINLFLKILMFVGAAFLLYIAGKTIWPFIKPFIKL